MSYYILPKNNNNIYVNPISVINKSDNDNIYLSCTLYYYYNELMEQIKNALDIRIDSSYNSYDEIIKVVNPYEYIFSKVPGSNFSVSKLKPKTNIFYDFLEISVSLNIFEIFNNNLSINSLHITKNYIDTIECFEFLRENHNDSNIYYDNLDEEIFKKIGYNKFDFLFFETNDKCINTYFINIIQFIMLILRNQNKDGISIIKINNLFFKPVLDMLYFVSSLFETVYVIKPSTSNITTFDKYIICKKFIYNDNKVQQYKINYIRLLYFLKKLENSYITSILDFELPYYFITKLDDMNIIIGQQQIEALDLVISILKNKNRNEKIEVLKKHNIQKCINWCEKYKIPYNKFIEKVNIFLPILKDTDNQTLLT